MTAKMMIGVGVGPAVGGGGVTKGACQVNATMLPSAEIEGSLELPIAPAGPGGRGARVTLFVWRSMTNTSRVLGWSPPERSVAIEVNATNRPFAETDGSIDPALGNGGPACLRET